MSDTHTKKNNKKLEPVSNTSMKYVGKSFDRLKKSIL